MTLPPISELIPHRRPMLLLDRVDAFDEVEASVVCSAELVVCPLVPAAGARAIVSLELMAQAAAACTGLMVRAGIDAGASDIAARGYLVGVPVLRLSVEHLSVGQRLSVAAQRVSSHGGTASFECAVTSDSQPVAEARLLVVKETS